MKTIGLLGGMSWESSAVYYRYLNEACRDSLGGLHSAKLLLWSADFAEVARLQHQSDWASLGAMLGDAALSLEQAGADAILICTNTMHKLADEIEARLSIPLLHIADATAEAIAAGGSKRPILLGTRFTMEDGFYQQRLRDGHGIECLVPDEAGRALVHQVIYEELCRGEIRDDSRSRLLDMIGLLADRGGDGLILGCTELPLLIRQSDLGIPAFDTTRLHSDYASRFALSA